MTTEYERVCVAWIDRATKTKEWCAVDGKPDPAALNDHTLCDRAVTMRVGTEKRVPTCPECMAELRRRRAERNKRHAAKRS